MPGTKNKKTKGAWRRLVAVSTFSIVLLVFGFVYWLYHIFTVVTLTECEYGLAWLDGWTTFASPFQIIGCAIVLVFAVWTLTAIRNYKRRQAETLAQLVFITGLGVTFIAQKAFLLPYGLPDRATVDRIVSATIWDEPLLSQERDEISINLIAEWNYDFPRPPFEKPPEHPRYDPNINRRLDAILTSRNSPTYGEIVALKSCVANYRRAVRKYPADLAQWNQYVEEYGHRFDAKLLSWFWGP